MRHLATGIAHEVNNILGAIIGNAHLVKGKLDPDHPAHAFLTAIRDASEEGRELMLELGRLASEQVLRQKPTDLNEVVAQALQQLPEDTACTTELAPELPLVELDPTLAAGVVAGLVEFGAGSCRAGGQAHVATCVVTEGGLKAVKLVVSDQGPSLSDDALETVCEPYAELPGRPKVGLRLTRVVDLADRFNGRLEVAHREPTGITVTLSFDSIS